MSNNKELEALRIENKMYKELLCSIPFFQVNRITNLNNDLSISFFKSIEGFLREILDLVPHHIVFTDKNGIITLCNLQTAKDLMVNRDEMEGKHIRELLRIPDNQIIMLETIKTGKEIVNREVLDRNYGIINTRILYNPNGTIERIIGVFQFLNDYKEAEKKAHLGRIAAGIAHEIRNPLTTVRGYLQLLDSKVEPEIADLFKTLLIPEIDRSNRIISDFLRISKPVETQASVMKVTEFFNDYLMQFLNSEALLHNVSISFEMKQKSDVDFKVDKEELIQVFINLFRNAIDAKKENQLQIELNTEIIHEWLLIRFIDNGIGIDPSLIPDIFDPFFTTKDEGTGLGLSLSKKIIESHGGSMEVSRSDINGTVFLIKLPLQKN
ncbi:two-component system sensor histidine kinase NtrB [Litchfieldia salsa]|uniref:histidine kinase n=1 Tax=Litchfieldia salsa TaxID=930152 RepID=A0A1H0TAW8_9BACI|nr:ATP-binding protein [Litchfieldia salsa]SDP50840.1 Signal transduction histidine kinase [Litchfieldia salsa]